MNAFTLVGGSIKWQSFVTKVYGLLQQCDNIIIDTRDLKIIAMDDSLPVTFKQLQSQRVKQRAYINKYYDINNDNFYLPAELCDSLLRYDLETIYKSNVIVTALDDHTLWVRHRKHYINWRLWYMILCLATCLGVITCINDHFWLLVSSCICLGCFSLPYFAPSWFRYRLQRDVVLLGNARDVLRKRWFIHIGCLYLIWGLTLGLLSNQLVGLVLHNVVMSHLLFVTLLFIVVGIVTIMNIVVFYNINRYLCYFLINEP